MHAGGIGVEVSRDKPVCSPLSFVGAGSDPELEAEETDERQREKKGGEELEMFA
jgi:hypothetical protein